MRYDSPGQQRSEQKGASPEVEVFLHRRGLQCQGHGGAEEGHYRLLMALIGRNADDSVRPEAVVAECAAKRSFSGKCREGH